MRDALLRYRLVQDPNAALLIADDHEAKKIVCAWQYCPVEIRRQPPDLEGKADAEAWDALWKCVRYDLTDLASRANLPLGIVRQKFEMVRAARLILPDGTLSRAAQHVLSADFNKHYGKKS